jgi:ABC-type uncharacterized transport system involved in gliding motility auxiliary subunit
VQAGYRVRQIGVGDEIPDTLPAILVLGGVEDFDDWALYRIDRYIQQGGKVLFTLNGVYIDLINGTLAARKIEDRGLLEMVASYGVTVRPELAMDRTALTMQYQTRSTVGMLQYRIVRYPLWIGVLPESRNPEHPVSARFSGVDLFWASPLELHAPEGVEGMPLFGSSPEAWTMQGDSFITNPETAFLFERDIAETKGPKIFGASLAGTFPGFFTGAPKPVREGSDEELPDMPASASPSRIVVVGDTNFASNMMQATEGFHNLDFLLQAVDWLGNDDDIIGIRSRQSAAGRLDNILDPEKRASAMRWSQIVNVAIIPLLVIVLGIALAWKRRNISARTKTQGQNAEQA